MIIPSIDLENGQAVQLIGGKEKALEAGDPRPIAHRFKLAGEIAVVDLDAALGRGSNTALIKELLQIAPCRVGGGIRDIHAAIQWLDWGAKRIVLGTAATPEILRELPRERVIAALDAFDGEVVIEGWQKKTGRRILERMKELEEFVGGFLVTFIEKEGRLGGTRLQGIEQLAEGANKARLTIAGGITHCDEIAQLDALGADAQVGMALYTHQMDLADAIAAPLNSDRSDGLWPTVVVDRHGVALGLVYSNIESLREAVRLQKGVYHSRSRGLWIKGKTSGATQKLLRIDLDCDRDTLRFIVHQEGNGFCHLHNWTCFGNATGLPHLSRRLQQRAKDAPHQSYTRRVLEEDGLLAEKLCEEAHELSKATTAVQVIHEAADVFYFTLVALTKAGVHLAEVDAELDRRMLRVTRRPGDAKNQ